MLGVTGLCVRVGFVVPIPSCASIGTVDTRGTDVVVGPVQGYIFAILLQGRDFDSEHECSPASP